MIQEQQLDNILFTGRIDSVENLVKSIRLGSRLENDPTNNKRYRIHFPLQ